MESVGVNVVDHGAVGGERTDLWPVLRNLIWVGDLGPDSPDVPDPWGLPPQGGPLAGG